MLGLAYRVGVCLVLLLVLEGRGAAQTKSGGLMKDELPVALIIANNSYAHADILKNSVSSALELAARLVENRYRVTFVTEADSLPTVRKKFPGGGAVKVLEANDTGELDTVVDEWLDKQLGNEESPAPFGFIAFSGHGEERAGTVRPVSYFLSRDDQPGTDGLNIRELQVKAGTKMLPLVLFLDMCRLLDAQGIGNDETRDDVHADDCNQPPQLRKAPRPETLKLIEENRGNRIQIRTPDDEPDIGPVTTIWATRTGEAALDAKHGLLKCLADGLEYVKVPPTFEARRVRAGMQSIVMDELPVERIVDLSLMTWAGYALTKLSQRYTWTQSGLIDDGMVDQVMIIASREKDYQYKRPAINIRGGWKSFAGGFKPLVNPQGVTFERMAGGNPDEAKATAFLGNSFAAENKFLCVELTAWMPNPMGNTEVVCQIQPGDNSTNIGSLSSQATLPRHLILNVPTQITMPLDLFEKGDLKSVTVSAVPGQTNLWPDGARVMVTKLLLVDQNMVAHNNRVLGLARPEPKHSVDLLSRWWFGDILQQKDSPVEIHASLAIEDNKRRTFDLLVDGNMNGELVGKGGPIYPPILVRADQHRLEIRTASVGQGGKKNKQSGTIFVTMLTDQPPGEGGQPEDKILLSDKITLLPNKHKYLINFVDTGVPTYFAITTKDAESVRITDIAIVPQ